MTLLGGGFGRKSKADFAIEAALLAKEVEGKPVKVVWTREDDLHHSFFHTVSVEHLEAGIDKAGKPVAWLHRSVGPTLMALFMPDPKVESAIELGMGLTNVPFAIPNMRVENPEAAAHTRIGWYRAVSNIPHAFAIQSFVAEMAHAAGTRSEGLPARADRPGAQDRPAHVNDTWNHGENPAVYVLDIGRLRNVTETAAKAAGWGGRCPRARAAASRRTTASSPTSRR